MYIGDMNTCPNCRGECKKASFLRELYAGTIVGNNCGSPNKTVKQHINTIPGTNGNEVWFLIPSILVVICIIIYLNTDALGTDFDFSMKILFGFLSIFPGGLLGICLHWMFGRSSVPDIEEHKLIVNPEYLKWNHKWMCMSCGKFWYFDLPENLR